MIKIVSILVAIISLIILSLLFYQWNQENAYKTEIENIFSDKIVSIELRSRYSNMPTFKIKEQQKIQTIKTWLLNAKGEKAFNFVPYPDALDQLVIMQSNSKNIINISPPDPARLKIQYKNYIMLSKPLPDSIEEIRFWKLAYEKRNATFRLTE